MSNMADKSFGVEELNLLGTGTPTIESPNSLNINASNVAISTNLTIGGKINSDVIISNYNVGIGTTIPTNVADINNTQILNVGIVTANRFYGDSFYGDGSGLTGAGSVEIEKDGSIVGSATTINFAKGIVVDSSTGSGIVTVSSSISGVGAGAGGKVSYSDYVSYSEFSYGARNIVGLETSYCITGIFTGSQSQAVTYYFDGTYLYTYHDPGPQFGNDVNCSSDGNTIVISSKGAGIANTTGHVYVYDRLGPGSNFNESILSGSGANPPTGTSIDYYEAFGSGIACSADGNTIYVGALREQYQLNVNPRIYIFDRVSRVGIESYFEEVGYIETEEEPLRMVCSADGNTLFVAHYTTDPALFLYNNGNTVDVYDRVENQLVGVTTIYCQQQPTTAFGRSLACNVDGSSLIVGTPDYDWGTRKHGAVFVYDREYQVGIGTTFTQVGILSGRDDTQVSGYEFGWSVACSNDATSIMVGEYEKGVVILPGGQDGRSGETGRVHVFDRKNCVGVGTTFTKVGILTGSASNISDYAFGASLACSADGNIIFVGDCENQLSGSSFFFQDNKFYRFDRQGNDFIETKIIDTDGGWALACSADASTVISAEVPGTDITSVRVYDLETKEIPLVRAGIGSTALYIDCKVSIADTTSNAGGAKYISTEAPSSGIGTFGDIWYNIGSEGYALANFDITSLPTSNQIGNANYLVRRGNQNYKVLGSDVSSDCQTGDLFLVHRPIGSGIGTYYKIDYEDMKTVYPNSFFDTHGYNTTKYPIVGFDFDPVNRMWMMGGGHSSLLMDGVRFLKVTSSLSSSNLDIPSASSSDWTDLTSSFPWEPGSAQYGLMIPNGVTHINDGTNSYWIVKEYYYKWKYSTETTTSGLNNASNWTTIGGGYSTWLTTGIPPRTEVIKYFDGKWIAFGNTENVGSSGYTAVVVDTSIDFDTSNRETDTWTSNTQINDIIKDTYNDLYIACGGVGTIATAPTSDIIDLTVRATSLGSTDAFISLATDGRGTTMSVGGFRSGTSGNYAKIAKSTDGINWSVISDSTIGDMEWLRDIEYYRGAWVACGRAKTGYDQVIYSIDNGDSWTELTISGYSGPSVGNGRFLMNEVKNVGGNWYVVGQQTQNKAGISTNFNFQNTDLFISNLTTSGITTVYKATGLGITSIL